MSDRKKPPSDVERIKAASGHLRGTLLEGLADEPTGALSEDDTQLTKFHGIYQQDDRDLRNERRQQKLEPAYSFMIRARVPAGACTPAQWIAMDALAQTHANGTLRITTRQAFQFHGVIKRRLKATMAGINASLLDTLAACGDVNRNVMCSPNPELSGVHAEAAEWARRISDHLTPRTRAYHEIWLDGSRQTVPAADDDEVEPIYGRTYLPRKFKIGVVVPPQNDVDIYTQDLGFIAITEDGRLTGFNVAVGGGMGMSHGEPETYPRLADVIGFCRTDQVLAVAEAVVKLQRDHGDRTNRKHARLKYTIDDMGVETFAARLNERLGFELAPAAEFVFTGNGDRYGWTRGLDGRWHLTLYVPSGRLADRGAHRLMTGLRIIARAHDGEFRLTPNQNVIVANVAEADKAAIESLARDHGLLTDQLPSALRLSSLSCVAFPTCGLAMAESERYLPTLLDRIEEMLESHDLTDVPITLRMTGCPNGCARPYVSEIGLVGKGPGRYNLHLGGGHAGERLNRPWRENVDEAEILGTLEPLLAQFAAERGEDEHFGDFLVRSGLVPAAAPGHDYQRFGSR
jgi:sulfite reductase (NADPH) hemoprotein beta-component